MNKNGSIKIIHFSDTHLGISGENKERENDFYKNFDKIIDDIIKIKPDYVIHTGDLFHTTKPTNKAISIAVTGFLKLSENNIKTIIIAGNHGTPRLSTTTHPFEIFKEIKNLYTISEAKTTQIEFENINFVALPHIHDEKIFKEEFQKSDTFIIKDKINIYMSHFGIQAKDYDEYTDEISGINILMEDLKKINKFDYVALGHYHKNFHIGKIHYSGSIEHTSFNQKKYKNGYNIVTFEKDKSYKNDFIKLDTRKMIDLGEVDCENILTSEELIKKLEKEINKSSLNGAIVKISFDNLTANLLLDFRDNIIAEFFENTFSFAYRKNKKIDKNKVNSSQININSEGFVENLFEDFIDKYEGIPKEIDKKTLKTELINEFFKK